VSLLGTREFKDLVGALRQLGFDKESAENDLRQALQELPREEWTVTELLQTAVEVRRERDRFWRENENAPLGSAHAAEAEHRWAHARHRIPPHPREPRPEYRFICVHP